MVLANKCELSFDQESVCALEEALKKDFPEVIYKEISVLLNFELENSMQELA